MQKKNIEDFAEQIANVLPRVIRWFHLNRANAMLATQINPGQFFVLEFIHESGSQRMSDLARQLHVSMPAITRMVDKLYVLKMVERMHGKQDRRVIRIDITLKGRKVVTSFQKQRKQAFVEIFAQLSEKDRQDYLRVMNSIHDIAYKKEII